MITSRFTADKRLQANVALLKKLMPQFTRDAVNEAAINIQSNTKKFITGSGGRDSKGRFTGGGGAVDTGQYRASIKIETFSGGYAQRVGSDLKYAIYVEMGRGPSKKFPPLEPIRRWCKRHNIPESAAFVIARKIKEHGIPARPALFPAYELERPLFAARIAAAYQNVKKQIV